MMEGSVLRVRLGVEGRHADLKELHRVAVHLREALYELAREQTEQESLPIRFEVVDAKIGSLELAIFPQGNIVSSEQLLSGFIHDIHGLAQGQFRPTMRTSTLNRYETLIKSVHRDTQYSFTYGKMQVVVDEQVKQKFQETLRLSPSYGLELVGWIESVNVSRKPYRLKNGCWTPLPTSSSPDALFVFAGLDTMHLWACIPYDSILKNPCL